MMTVIIVGETGVVYKGHLNRQMESELVAIKTGKGMQYIVRCVFSVTCDCWDNCTIGLKKNMSNY